MKANIFFTIVAAAAITSCSQNEVLDTMSTQSEINFRTTIGKQTRAAEATKTTLEKDINGFSIVGYTTQGDYISSATVPTSFFSDVLKYQTMWKADKTLYWPTDGKNLSVFSVYPTKIGTKSLAIVNPTTGGAYPTLAVTIPALDNQVDLLLANTMNQTAQDKALAIKFQHVLSQVRFSAKTADGSYQVKIKSIELQNAASLGTFTFNGAATVGTWKTTTDANRINYMYNSTIFPKEADLYISNTDQAIPSTNDAGALMLMPQAKHNDFLLSVTYMIVNPAGITLADPVTKTVPMEALEMGKKYLYRLTLPVDKGNMTPITFTVDVTDWESDTNIDVSYFVLKCGAVPATDATSIANNIASFCGNRTSVPGVKIAKHTVEINGLLGGDMDIDLSAVAGGSLENDDEIILDFSRVDFGAIPHKITVDFKTSTSLGFENSAEAKKEITAASKLVLKKKVTTP